jgi:hypothetical protein
MNWIKKNYDQFILGIVALVLLGLSGLLINNALSFQQIFASIKGQVYKNNNVPPIDTTDLKNAVAALKNPAQWELSNADGTEGSLFISIPYVASADGTTLIDPRTGPPLHPPVPNKWLIANKLDLLDNNVLNEDPDGDGFTNLDEWMGVKGDGSDSTDPQDKTSHPPYWTKLKLAQYIKQPFRLLFNAYDGDPTKPPTMEFQINTVDVNQPTQFVKFGDTIAGTKFKVIKFEVKSVTDSNTGSQTDVSELTVQNNETGDNVVLVLGQVANSPDSYADFRYLWNNTEFQVKKGKEFALLPDADLRYKLIDITEDSALIQTPTGQQVKIPKLQ